MLSLVPVPVLHSPAPAGDSFEEQLLEGLAPLDGSHVLVLGVGQELVAGLIRRGCLAVTLLRRLEKPEVAAHDLMLVPQVAEEDDLERLVCQARRTLVPTGELIACMAGPAAEAQARRLTLRLRLNGFTGMRRATLAGGVLMRAELPAFGMGAQA